VRPAPGGVVLEAVAKSYRTPKGPHRVLHEASLSLPAGVSAGLIGRNGAGKSTLLRVLARAESTDAGVVRVPASTSWAIGLTSGIATALTGRQNTRFVARLHGADTAQMRDIERYTAEFSELGRAFDAPTGTYSSGMRSRLSFALAMAIDFDLVLLDEITAVGDEAFRNKCRAALRERKARTQFIIASHSRAELEATVDWGVFVFEGRLYTYESVGAAFDAYRDWMHRQVHPVAQHKEALS
jgi:capsular polysaccharide transport system ATP-binding protein